MATRPLERLVLSDPNETITATIWTQLVDGHVLVDAVTTIFIPSILEGLGIGYTLQPRVDGDEPASARYMVHDPRGAVALGRDIRLVLSEHSVGIQYWYTLGDGAYLLAADQDNNGITTVTFRVEGGGAHNTSALWAAFAGTIVKARIPGMGRIEVHADALHVVMTEESWEAMPDSLEPCIQIFPYPA